MRLNRRACLVGLMQLSLASAPAFAQIGGGKPIRIIVGQPAGGGTDVIARLVAQNLAEQLGQTVVVDNRPGAGGTIGNAALAAAAPDGLTLMLGEISALSISPTLYPETVNPQKAFDMIGLVAENTFAILTNPATGIETFADLLARAKAAPNRINYATPGNGTLQHLAMELLKMQTRVPMQHIPYKGGAPATMSVLSNETPIAAVGIPPILSHVASGKLKALAVGSSQRSKDLPNVPTLAESGIRNFEAVIWYGLVAPAGTPRDVIKRLNEASIKATQNPVVKAGFAKVGVEPRTSTPEQYAELVAAERSKWAAVIRDAKVKVD